MRRRVQALLVALTAGAMPVGAVLVDEVLPADGITITASSTFSPLQDARHVIDGSGLAEGGHDCDGGARTMWHSAEHPVATVPAGGLAPAPAWIRIDLPAAATPRGVRIWNHNQAGLTDRGFRRARVCMSADGANWQVRAIEIPRAAGSDAEPSSLEVQLDGRPVRSLILAADTNYGGTCFGVSEVQLLTRREVKESELPFPASMDCIARPVYGHRADGTPGREVTLRFAGAALWGDFSIEVMGETTRFTNLQGVARLSVLLPPGVGVTNSADVAVSARRGERSLTGSVAVPRRKLWTVMLFPHSHVDIGYTNPQDVVEKIHVRNLDVGIELGRATADRPPGERHVWNTEVGWVVERWLAQAGPERRRAFVEAVKKGWVSLAASYDNANTSACSDEELLHFFDFARELRALTGDPVDTMCQFDVPGMSWGIAQAAAQSGVKAILAFPNPSDRIGGVRTWENRPFYWVAPDGVSKVLYLQCFPYNVAWKLGAFNLSPRPFADVPGRDRIFFATSALNGTGEFKFEPFILGEIARQEEAGSPYDIYPCAWSLSDNAPVDAALPDFVQQWNRRYASPRLVMAGAHEIAETFAQRFGAVIPTRRGDLTEYWTDGLGSDARRVGYNRVAKEQLVQAETLWAMWRRGYPFPRTAFSDAWRWIQLGSEHTWGYMMPDHPLAKMIEHTKSFYFEQARDSAAALLAEATGAPATNRAPIVALNTLSWTRSGLVVVPPEAGLSPVQRLASGETVFLARDVPPLAAAVLAPTSTPTDLRAEGCTLENARIRVRVDPRSGDIVSLVDKSTGHDFAATNGPYALNSFRYLRGAGLPATATGPSNVTVSVSDRGPLVASLRIASDADGCRSLVREVRLVAGAPSLEIRDTIDKIPTFAKEGIHHVFALNIPGGRARMDIPWGVMDPQADQLDGANKDWLAFQRWIDVSNDKVGATWVGIEAGLVEFGDLTARLLGAVQLAAWSKRVGDVTTIVSWALNNHWHTNFPLTQGGVIPFRYALLVHGAWDPVAANRFGLEQHRPLAVASGKDAALSPSLVELDNPRIFVSTVRPSADRRALILRLRSLSDQSERVSLRWGRAGRAFVSDGDEARGSALDGPVALLPYGAATIRMEDRG